MRHTQVTRNGCKFTGTHVKRYTHDPRDLPSACGVHRLAKFVPKMVLSLTVSLFWHRANFNNFVITLRGRHEEVLMFKWFELFVGGAEASMPRMSTCSSQGVGFNSSRRLQKHANETETGRQTPQKKCWYLHHTSGYILPGYQRIL